LYIFSIASVLINIEVQKGASVSALLECWYSSVLAFLFMVLVIMFADKGQQEARVRDMILREEEYGNLELFLHLMPMLNW